MQEGKTAKHKALESLASELQEFLGGKKAFSDAVLASLLAGGHILIEDVPGLGKTSFIKALAKLLGLSMKRVQFTADLLPSDILGVQVFEPSKKSFVFHKGPIFTEILLADELNRASAKTQSALLEAMEEKTVTVDQKTFKLSSLFFVIATQNPSDSLGTFLLPESQLDRFFVKLKLDYPSKKKEAKIFKEASLDPLKSLSQNLIVEKDFKALQEKLESVHVSSKIIDCVQAVIQKSREHQKIKLGLSTRAGVQWVRLSKARALLEKRDFVTPDDLLFLAPFCLMHRLVFYEDKSELVFRQLLEAVVI